MIYYGCLLLGFLIGWIACACVVSGERADIDIVRILNEERRRGCYEKQQ